VLKIFLLIGVCNQKSLETTDRYYHNMPPLPGWSAWRVLALHLQFKDPRGPAIASVL